MVDYKLKGSKKIITVAGTVGVGKSTLTHSLAKELGYKTSFEKVDGNPYLEDFYGDLKRWSFNLQIYFLSQRFQEQMRMYNDNEGFIQDRSIYEDVGIFAKMLKEQGNMSNDDFDTYNELFNSMVFTPFFPKPDVLIYISGDFDKIIERMNIRGREMEKQTSVAYWKDLYQRYEKWISEYTISPVIRLNIEDYDLVKDPTSIRSIIEKIEKQI